MTVADPNAPAAACSNCGQPRERDGQYCVKCGHEFPVPVPGRIGDERIHERLRSGQPVGFPVSANQPESGAARTARTISAAWLNELAEGPGRVIGVPVEVSGAVIDGRLELSSAKFEHTFSITKSDFKDEVDLSSTTCNAGLEFRDSRFARLVTLRASQIQGDLNLSGAQFQGLAQFDNLTVKGSIFGQNQASVERPQLKVDTDVERSIQVTIGRRTASVSGLHFEKSASFAGARVGGDAAFGDASFDDEALFERFRVDGAGFFDGASFGGKASFLASQIIGDVTFHHARFEKDVSFERFVVGGHARFRGNDGPQGPAVVFKQAVSFRGARVDGGMTFVSTQFAGAATFDGLRVGGDLTFSAGPRAHPVRVSFSKECSFRAVSIGGHLGCAGVRFGGESDFSDLHVGGSASFNRDKNTGTGVEFTGKADFVAARFEGDADFDDSRFDQDIEFGRVEALGLVTFQRAVFRNQASFSFAQFGAPVAFKAAQFKGPALFEVVVFKTLTGFEQAQFEKDISFRSTRFMGDAIFSKVTFGGQPNFTAIVADRDVKLDEAKFGDGATFVDSQARQVMFRTETTPDPPKDKPQFLTVAIEQPDGNTRAPKGVDLRGFTYRRIFVAWRELLSRMEPYDRESYTQLEGALRAMDRERDAEDIFLARHAYERHRLWRPEGKSRGFWRDTWDTIAAVLGMRAVFDAALWILAHYGVRPYPRLVLTSLSLVLLGVLVFTFPQAVVAKPEPVPAGESARVAPLHLTWQQALGVSVSQFVPLELPAGSQWKPSDKYIRFGDDPQSRYIPVTYAFYATLQRIFGLILVPLFVAAVSGVLYRRPPGGARRPEGSGSG